MSSHQKQKLRQRVQSNRRRLDPSSIKKSSQTIAESLIKLSLWQTKQAVHLYLPIEKSNEVDTWPIINWLLENGHEVWSSYLPEDESKDGFCKINKDTNYKLGRYNIPLPQEKVVQNCQPDVIIAACVAADRNGNRLGHGNGWTDRFFAEHPESLRIGLVYDQFLFDEIPREPHDKLLDIVVTEKSTIRTDKR